MDELLEERQDRDHREDMAAEFEVAIEDFNAWVDDWGPADVDGMIVLEINESAPASFIEQIDSHSSYEYRKNFT